MSLGKTARDRRNSPPRRPLRPLLVPPMPTGTDTLRATLRDALAANAGFGRVGYVYGYPHKKAYRPLAVARSLREAWAEEGRDRLFCYVHLPFCGQRCSFCNLFTYVPGDASPVPAYLDALGREMEAYAAALSEPRPIGRGGGAPFRFARLYLGGGTPTYLTAAELRLLVERLRGTLGIAPALTHGCIEASPETLDADKVDTLRDLGFQRLSLGVQSFDAEELRQVNRRFDFALHRHALDLVRRAGFPQVNVDLIYGLPGQTLVSWRDSLAQAIDSPATSLFLYPLYVRPLTGLAVRQPAAPTADAMAAMYDHAVESLTIAGFWQVTTRQFRRDAADDQDEYRCQRDGMVGLGAGARSYTAGLHYSTPWKMVARNIRGVIDDYAARMRAGDTRVTYGVELDADERLRRATILGLLHDGVEMTPEVLTRFADIWEALTAESCLSVINGRARLTARGVRQADVIGELFFSDAVRRRMTEWEYDE